MNNNGYQFPWIPLSQLRELYKTAQTLVLEEDAGVDEKWVWYMLIRRETDRIMIQYYQTQLYRAATYIGIEGYACPLCTYENGVFIKLCSLHQQIENLTAILLRVTEASVNQVNELIRRGEDNDSA